VRTTALPPRYEGHIYQIVDIADPDCGSALIVRFGEKRADQ